MASRRFGARSALRFSLCAGFLFSLVATQVACSNGASQHHVPNLELRSASFSGDTIPNAYSSCDAQRNVSPQLYWSAPPEGTQSFALVVIDKDSPLGWNFVHWVLYDIPADKRELPEAIAAQEQLPDGSVKASMATTNPAMWGHAPRDIRPIIMSSLSSLWTPN